MVLVIERCSKQKLNNSSIWLICDNCIFLVAACVLGQAFSFDEQIHVTFFFISTCPIHSMPIICKAIKHSRAVLKQCYFMTFFKRHFVYSVDKRFLLLREIVFKVMRLFFIVHVIVR